MPPRIRLLACVGALVALVAALVPATVTTADAAKRKPARVGLVQVVAASPTSLVLRWPKAKRAKKYVVELSTNLQLTDRRIMAKVRATQYTLSGLTPGKVYCFRVQSSNPRGKAIYSRRSCKPTIVTQGAVQGAVYRMLTYNLCSNACPNWKERRSLAAGLVLAARPDVVALQETRDTAEMESVLPGFSKAIARNGRWLLYRTTRFQLLRTGHITLGSGDRYAVWAELSDRTYGGRIFVVNVHLSFGSSAAADAKRLADMQSLIPAVQQANQDDLPVLYIGDFNSHRNRQRDWPAAVLRGEGYVDSFDLAMSLQRPNFNSGNQGLAKPYVSYTWGDHLDHLYVDPRSTRVLQWANVARIAKGRYRPLASNHNPVLMVVQVNKPGARPAGGSTGRR